MRAQEEVQECAVHCSGYRALEVSAAGFLEQLEKVRGRSRKFHEKEARLL